MEVPFLFTPFVFHLSLFYDSFPFFSFLFVIEVSFLLLLFSAVAGLNITVFISAPRYSIRSSASKANQSLLLFFSKKLLIFPVCDW